MYRMNVCNCYYGKWNKLLSLDQLLGISNFRFIAVSGSPLSNNLNSRNFHIEWQADTCGNAARSSVRNPPSMQDLDWELECHYGELGIEIWNIWIAGTALVDWIPELGFYVMKDWTAEWEYNPEINQSIWILHSFAVEFDFRTVSRLNWPRHETLLS